MDSAALIGVLRELAPDARVDDAPSSDAHMTIFVEPEDLIPVMRALREGPALAFAALALALRDRPEHAFTFLSDLTAVDYWPREPRFELVYLLVSIANRQRLRLKVRLDGSDPHISTVSGVWPAANWLEREVWDLFGIAFDGHPDPRRLLMPEDWEGFPLRKDYPVQIRMTPTASQPLQVSEEEFRASVTRDRLTRER